MSTRVAEAHWAVQHQNYGPGWAESYWSSRVLPSRQAVLDVLARLKPPWKTLVELGCNSGPMLARIAEAFPDAKLAGIEVNQTAAEAAAKNLPGATILRAGMTEWIQAQPEQSFDVLVTHYTLAYVAPQDIEAMIWHCRRVACHVVLAEPTTLSTDTPAGLIYAFPEWRHDYAKIAKTQKAKSAVAPLAEPVGHLNAVVTISDHAC